MYRIIYICIELLYTNLRMTRHLQTLHDFLPASEEKALETELRENRKISGQISETPDNIHGFHWFHIFPWVSHIHFPIFSMGFRQIFRFTTPQASPPQLIAPVSRSLRQRWQKLGARLVADADPRCRKAFQGRRSWSKMNGSYLYNGLYVCIYIIIYVYIYIIIYVYI